MARVELTPEQAAEADRIEAALPDSCRDDVRRLAELLASKPDREPLGATEFEVRDRSHRIGAEAIRSALAGRKKGATTAPPAPARTAARPPSPGGVRPRRS